MIISRGQKEGEEQISIPMSLFLPKIPQRLQWEQTHPTRGIILSRYGQQLLQVMRAYMYPNSALLCFSVFHLIRCTGNHTLKERRRLRVGDCVTLSSSQFLRPRVHTCSSAHRAFSSSSTFPQDAVGLFLLTCSAPVPGRQFTTVEKQTHSNFDPPLPHIQRSGAF
jgi:hypothetical protein